MKYFILFLTLTFTSINSKAQSLKVGLEIAPTFQFQLLRDQQTKIRSSLSGSGFSSGLIFQRKIKEYTAFNSGLKIDFIAFNQKSGDFLVYSYRILGLNLPLSLSRNIGLSENWLYTFGGGVNFNFINRSFGIGNWININPIVNRVQPYLALGLSYVPNSGSNFEMGASARYNLIDNYNKNNQILTHINTHLAAFEFSLKYFINSGEEN